MRGKGGLQGRAAQTGLAGDDLRLRVDGGEPVHPPQVERDDAGEPVPGRGQAAHHRRPAAEGHHRQPLPGAHPQHGENLVVIRRQDDGVRGVEGVTGAQAQQVGGGPAPAVPDAAAGVVTYPARPDHARQSLARFDGQ